MGRMGFRVGEERGAVGPVGRSEMHPFPVIPNRVKPNCVEPQQRSLAT